MMQYHTGDVNNTIEMLVNLDDIEIILNTNTPQLVLQLRM
jgi:hypothetical protein